MNIRVDTTAAFSITVLLAIFSVFFNYLGKKCELLNILYRIYCGLCKKIKICFLILCVRIKCLDVRAIIFRFFRHFEICFYTIRFIYISYVRDRY
jgi:hypothetical protein